MKSVALVITLAALPACFAIDDPNDGAECLKAAHCDAGETCVGGRCVIVCDLQMDCAEGRYCNPSGLCVPVDTTGTPPVLTAVRGNDTLSESRIRDGLIVSGDNLVLASFELRANGRSYPMATRERSNTRVEVTFPLDIRSGEYMLLATNASGEASTGLTLTLPEVTPELVLSKLNASTGTVSLDRLPMDLLVSEDELAPYPTRDELTGDMLVGRINASTSTIAYERLPTGTIVTQAQMTSALGPYAKSVDLTGDTLISRINATGTTGVVATSRLHSDVVLASELSSAVAGYATTTSVSNVAQDLGEHVAEAMPTAWNALPLAPGIHTYGTETFAPAYRRVYPDLVCLRGLAQRRDGFGVGISMTHGQNLAYLPPGHGPSHTLIVVTGCNSDRLNIFSNGDIALFGGDYDSCVSFDNVCFSTSD